MLYKGQEDQATDWAELFRCSNWAELFRGSGSSSLPHAGKEVLQLVEARLEALEGPQSCVFIERGLSSQVERLFSLREVLIKQLLNIS